MKIGPHTHSFAHEPPRGAGRRPVDSRSDSTTTSAPQTAGKPEDTDGRKAIPPGLERVQARLQAMSERNQGQSNALDRISRNIARYQETQALAGTPPSAPTPPPAPASTAATAPAEPTPPAATTEAPPPVTADAGSPAAPTGPSQETPAPSA